MNNCSNKIEEFKFSNHDDIGSASAEDDVSFLKECFIDTGDVDVLLDTKNSKRIIVGRTGAGKSALINHICNITENTIHLSPHSLSLNYIANNNVISFFEEAGVNLSVFYGLLWRHILVVELLKSKFHITSENAQKDYTRHIRKILCKKDKFKEMAVEYLEQWGNKFWLTTDQRMQELTNKIEKSLSGSIGSELEGIDLTVRGAKNLSQEERLQVIQIGKKVVSEIQIRELQNIIDVLDEEIFNDPQQNYYVVIDELDEEWVDERIKYNLIKALIDSIRRFKKVKTIKIIIAMRQDLLDKVVLSNRELGFQEEKYESMYLRLSWSRKYLMKLVEKRISFLVSRKYTNRIVTWDDIFPANIDKQPTIDYLVDRTFARPRDMIAFVNECVYTARGDNKITAHTIKISEEEYSFKRLQSLATEWQIIHPDLYEVSQMLLGMPARFELSTVTEKWFEERYIDVFNDISPTKIGRLHRLIDSLYSANSNFSSVRNTFFRELYMTGLIGIKTGSTSTVNWSHHGARSLSPGQLRPNSYIYIHPMFYRTLDIRHPISGK